MKLKVIASILLFLLSPQLSISSTQYLTYDNPTNQINISYDSLNRIPTKNTTSVNPTKLM